MEFNIKGISNWAWIKLGIVVAFMISMIAFEVGWNDKPVMVNFIGAVIIAWIFYEVLKALNVLKKR